MVLMDGFKQLRLPAGTIELYDHWAAATGSKRWALMDSVLMEGISNAMKDDLSGFKEWGNRLGVGAVAAIPAEEDAAVAPYPSHVPQIKANALCKYSKDGNHTWSQVNDYTRCDNCYIKKNEEINPRVQPFIDGLTGEMEV